MIRSTLIGCGAYLPKNVKTNFDLEKEIDTTHDWIVSRTGIEQRSVAADDQVTSDLAVRAAEKAIQAAGIDKDDIDMIVVGTTTPDRTFPSTAVYVQEKLGIKACFAFDLNAACSGFVYAMTVADKFIKTGESKMALVIGAETFTRLLDWEDRTTSVLFGDGAGAVILKAEEQAGTNKDTGILYTKLLSDSETTSILNMTGGISMKTFGAVHMDGRGVFKHAVNKLAGIIDDVLDGTGISPSDIDWLVPHQANKRIIDSMAKKLSLPYEKVIITVDKHANTSAASVPLALAEGLNDGRIKKGDLVLMEALGGGLTWGAALVRV